MRILVQKPPRLRLNYLRLARSCPFLGASRLMLGPGDRSVYVVHIPLQISAPLELFKEGISHLLPDALLATTAKAAVEALPGSVALRQITPVSTSARQPDDGVDDQIVIQRWTLPPCSLRPQQRMYQFPLRIGAVSHHGAPRRS